jgi:hypothetical protein
MIEINLLVLINISLAFSVKFVGGLVDENQRDGGD